MGKKKKSDVAKNVSKLYFTFGGLLIGLSLVMFVAFPKDIELMAPYAFAGVMGVYMIVIGGMVYACRDKDKED